eukprot:Gb_37706 [translate_table: standard]
MDTIRILWSVKEKYEDHHGVTMNLVDEACANVRVQLEIQLEEIDNLGKRMMKSMRHGEEKFCHCVEKLVLVKGVWHEIRDPVSRHKLVLTPVNIQSMEPTKEALRFLTGNCNEVIQCLEDIVEYLEKNELWRPFFFSTWGS